MKTRIQERKQVFASNRQYIQKIANLTEMEHNQIVYDTGMQFLKYIFPPGDVYDNDLALHERSKIFWNWWKAEFKKWESEFMQFLKENKIISFSLKFYKQQLTHIHKSKNIDESFYHNYLTKYKNQLMINGLQK